MTSSSDDKSQPRVIPRAALYLRVSTARQRIRLEGGGFRRDHLRALAQCVEVAEGEVRIMGSKSRLLQTLGSGGEGGIRTHGTLTRTTVFETVPIDHSGTSPR
jgi:site-specific DNA recombinase